MLTLILMLFVVIDDDGGVADDDDGAGDGCGSCDPCVMDTGVFWRDDMR